MIEPLQPLRDDLFSIVYSEFEKDENKYEQYKSAMELALNDIKEEAPEQPIKILFVGPGHGKLIDKLMELLQEFTYNIKIFAYEKNQICTQTLHDKNVRFWNNQVHLTMADVRDVESIVIPDILVSEMLGSFGDNEGCPEILSRFNSPGCRPRIMIPQSYTSYLQPIYTPIEVPSNTRPYLVNLTRFYEVDEPTSVWTWEHPSSQLETREMSKELVFHNNSHGRRISGFYGYFTSNLYGHVSISINRIDVDRSNFCSSWYPIYFPVKAARLEKGEGITFTINRYNDGKKVWYQWNYRGYTYNEDGAGYTIEL
ncbi:methyltransferase family protein [Scheffersomyces xylosifermentans]|uniref:methyltransferase family protein n=1 Tax=Scheffersomyces xylosifermentans TaxID=1304137 RepID=UPI00315D3273